MAAGSDVMGSSSDMLAAVDWGDSFSDTGDTGADAGADTGGAGDGAELESPGALESEPADAAEPIEEPESPVADEEPVAQDEPEPAPPVADELPEGVRRGKDRNGKEGLWLTPQRYESFHGAHKTLRDFEGVVGEPITPEVLDVRNRAFMGQERLYSDLLSAEPEAQAKVLGHFFDEAQRAYQDGEVGSDPTISLGQAMYDTLQQRSPDAYAHLRMRAAGDLVNEMYVEAQKSGNKDLAISVSHVAKSLGLAYKKDAEITQFLATPPANADPVANLRAENERLQAQLNGRQSETAAAQFRSWHTETSKAVTAGVLSEAVMPSLSEEKKAWEKFPSQFDNLVVAPLNKAARQTVMQDKNFTARIAGLEKLAHRATSAQKLAEYAGQIKQAYINRFKLAVDAHKKGVLQEAAVLLKKDNDATHARRQAAQNQRGPRGPQNPVPRSIVPSRDVVNPGGLFDSKAEAARLDALFK